MNLLSSYTPISPLIFQESALTIRPSRPEHLRIARRSVIRVVGLDTLRHTYRIGSERYGGSGPRLERTGGGDFSQPPDPPKMPSAPNDDLHKRVQAFVVKWNTRFSDFDRALDTLESSTRGLDATESDLLELPKALGAAVTAAPWEDPEEWRRAFDLSADAIKEDLHKADAALEEARRESVAGPVIDPVDAEWLDRMTSFVATMNDKAVSKMARAQRLATMASDASQIVIFVEPRPRPYELYLTGENGAPRLLAHIEGPVRAPSQIRYRLAIGYDPIGRGRFGIRTMAGQSFPVSFEDSSFRLCAGATVGYAFRPTERSPEAQLGLLVNGQGDPRFAVAVGLPVAHRISLSVGCLFGPTERLSSSGSPLAGDTIRTRTVMRGGLYLGAGFRL